MTITTLRGRKTVYAKQCDSWEAFSWLGKCARMGGTETPKGDINVTYKQADVTGKFERDQEYRSAPGPSTSTVMMKETIRNAIYDDLQNCPYDFDIRTINCGHRSDPLNWDMIKRFCCANATTVSTDDETAYSPDDEGEIIVTMPISALDEPVIIYSNIVGQRVEEVDLTLYYISRISRCHSELCADSCGPAKECKLVGTAIADTPSNPPRYAVSDDGGRSWAIRTIAVFTVATGLDDIACYGDLMIAVASGEPGFAVSKDAGATWSLIDDTEVPEFAIYAPRTVTIYDYDNILIGGDAGYIWLASNGGFTVEAVEEGVVTGGRITRIEYVDANTIFAVGQSNTGKQSGNGGQTWTVMTLPIAKAGSDVEMLQPITAEIVLIGYGDGGLYYSEDGGDSFSRDVSVAATYPIYGSAMCGCGVIWIAGGTGAEGVVYRNVDYGYLDRWHIVTIDDPGVLYRDIVCCNPNHAVAVGGPSGVYGAGVVTLIE